MAGPPPVLNPVDDLLGMFDTEADGKGFGRQGDPPLRQFPVGVVGGLPGRENQMIRPDLFRTVHDDPDQFPLSDQKIGHARPETDLAAHPDQPVAEIHHDLPQAVRPDVGAGVRQDVRRRPHVRKNPFDPGGVRIFDPRRQFAVGKGPRAALPEMDVALRVQDSRFPEGADVGETLRNRLPPFEQKDGHPLRGERQGGEKPRRSAAGDNRPSLKNRGAPRWPLRFFRNVRRLRHTYPRRVLSRTRSPADAVHQPDGQQKDKTGRAGTPRIDRPPDHPEIGDRTLGKAEEGGDTGGEKVLSLAQGESQTVDLQYHCFLPLKNANRCYRSRPNARKRQMVFTAPRRKRSPCPGMPSTREAVMKTGSVSVSCRSPFTPFYRSWRSGASGKTGGRKS